MSLAGAQLHILSFASEILGPILALKFSKKIPDLSAVDLSLQYSRSQIFIPYIPYPMHRSWKLTNEVHIAFFMQLIPGKMAEQLP